MKHATESIAIPAELVARLASVARTEDTTIATALAAGFAALLSRYTGQDEISIALPARESVVVLRAHITDDLDVRKLLRHVSDRTVGARVPAPDAARALAMFAYEDAPSSDYDLTLRLVGNAGALRGSIEYRTDLYLASAIVRLCGHYLVLLDAIASDPTQHVRTLPMLTAQERTQIAVEWNDTRTELPETCAHRLFEAQVARAPDAAAVVFEGATLSYRELDERANRVAHHLRKAGVGPDVLVGVCIGRSTQLAVALLGVWKAGGAYVPLDPTLPAERLAFMLRDASVKALLTTAEHRSAFAGESLATIAIDTDWPEIEKESAARVESAVAPSNLAYVMYTSGSTGKPKGVMILHKGLVNYLLWAKDAYAAGAGDAVPVHSSIAFDLTVTALFVPLIAGGCIEMLREDVGGQNLTAAVRRGRDRSLVKITPAHLLLLSEQLGEAGVAGRTKLFVIGGESLLAERLQLWRDHAPATRLINEYGPTETVVGCCVHELSAEDGRSGAVAIGRPIANTQLYVLDRHMNLVPPGIVGELHIGGAGVARGYLNRAELTEQRFVPDPFSSDRSARLYKTGDLARYRTDGVLECLGRADDQVKVRGYRIELGEIEATLASIATVKSCAVVTRDDAAGTKQLVAYVCDRGTRPTVDDLRQALGKSLPEYMIPTQIVFLDEMPLTTNGKIDRQALAAPSRESAGPARVMVAPSTPVEKKMVEIWKELLGLNELGVNESFFELGGHSLLALKAMSRIQESLAVDLSPEDLLDVPTIAGLAKLAEERG